MCSTRKLDDNYAYLITLMGKDQKTYYIIDWVNKVFRKVENNIINLPRSILSSHRNNGFEGRLEKSIISGRLWEKLIKEFGEDAAKINDIRLAKLDKNQITSVSSRFTQYCLVSMDVDGFNVCTNGEIAFIPVTDAIKEGILTRFWKEGHKCSNGYITELKELNGYMVPHL